MIKEMPLLSLSNVRVTLDGRNILDIPSLTLNANDHTVILGANGSGKSTLVKLITRQLYPAFGGELRIFGEEAWNVFALRRQLGIVSGAVQIDFDAEPPIEVLDCVVSSFFASRGLWAHHDHNDAMLEAAHQAIAMVGADHLIGRHMNSLSTGEARRVLIARALVHQPRAILLDEPCAGLDPAARHHFLKLLRDIARTGTGILLITHHVEEILPEMDRIIMLRKGRIFREGRKADLLTGEALSDLFELPMVVPSQNDWFHAAIATP